MNLHFADDGRLYHTRQLEGDCELALVAQNVRQERTGVHARLAIGINKVYLSWGVCNVERDDERARLVRSAYDHIKGPLADVLRKEELKHEVDLFCLELWPAVVGACSPVEVEGDPDSPPATFIVPDLIVESGGTILYGPPGKGKSYVALSLAVSVDAGIDTIWGVRQTPALFINLERSAESVARRLAGVNKALGLEVKRPLAMLNARGRALADVDAGIRQYVREHGTAFLVLDSMSRTRAGDLLEGSTANSIVDRLNAIGPSWLALGHTPRADETHVYGSIFFEAGADACVKLSSQQVDGTLGLGLTVTKANDFAKPPPAFLALEFGEYGLTAIRTARSAEFPQLEAGLREGLPAGERCYLLLVQPMTTGQLAEELGLKVDTVIKACDRHPRIMKAGHDGKQVLWARVSNLKEPT